jgi:hypothetical protein
LRRLEAEKIRKLNSKKQEIQKPLKIEVEKIRS